MGHVIKSVARAVLHVLSEVLLLGIHYSLKLDKSAHISHSFFAILCFFSGCAPQTAD